MKPKLTPLMVAALEAAIHHNEGLRRTFDGKPGQPTWPHPHATLAALVRRGLLEARELRNRKGQRVQAWFITEDGRRALTPVLLTKRDRPLYLAHSGAIRYRLLPSGRWTVDDTAGGSGDYTTDPSRSIDHDLMPGAKQPTAVEVIVGASDLAQFAKHARMREQKRRREAGKLLDAKTISERLDFAARVARERHMDFSREARLIRHMAANGRENAAMQRLVAIERQLGQRAA